MSLQSPWHCLSLRSSSGVVHPEYGCVTLCISVFAPFLRSFALVLRLISGQMPIFDVIWVVVDDKCNQLNFSNVYYDSAELVVT